MWGLDLYVCKCLKMQSVSVVELVTSLVSLANIHHSPVTTVATSCQAQESSDGRIRDDLRPRLSCLIALLTLQKDIS